MSSRRPATVLQTFTQAVQTIHAKVQFSRLGLKKGARVPELKVWDAQTGESITYPLLGEQYQVGRSSRSDIPIANAIVSKKHFSLTRGRGRGTPYVLRDDESTNGVYLGKRRVREMALRHGDVLTLGPPELQAAVEVRYLAPPRWWQTVLRYGVYGLVGVTSLIGLGIGVEWQRVSVQPIPPFKGGPVVVFDRNNKPLQDVDSRSYVALKQLSAFSTYLPDAVVASEDSRFLWHVGVDPVGIARALVTNVRGGSIQEGASTLSQQLARNLFREYVGTEDSVGRKLREMVVALKLETFYSKDELLLLYLNRVYLGTGNFGFETASQFYFGKSARDLTLSEAATLAGVLPAPNAFNPVKDYDEAIRGRDRIIRLMERYGMVTAEESNEARRSRLEINPKAREVLQGTTAPYFYSHVFNELEALLGNQLATEGNFVIETALDREMQNRAEANLQVMLDTDGASLGFSQGAIVTLDASTGLIRAMVGGTDFKRQEFNMASQALRQPGSTFKIFAYTAALEKGISPGTAYPCGDLTWEGQTYGGCRSGSGAVDMYTGVASSENVVALRVAQDVGLDAVVGMARRMGVTSDLKAVPGLVLGQSEVTVLEMTGAFGVLANGGVFNPPRAIARILDSSNCKNTEDWRTCRVIYDQKQSPESNQRVLDEDVAWQMTNLLQGVVKGGTGRNAYLGRGEAGKTGTTNDNVDMWFVGFVPDEKLVTGVWLGNEENIPTSGSSAMAASLWGTYMGQVLP